MAASQEERFTGVKHEAGFPSAAILDCLARAGLTPDSVDLCAFAEKPVQSLIFDQLGRPTNPVTWLLSRLVPDEWLEEGLPGVQFWNPTSQAKQARAMFPGASFVFAWHHLSHAAAAFATSPFERAAFLCLDGKGEDSSASIGVVTSDRIEILHELPWENGLGLLYTAVTRYLGFGSFGSEYKVMGLAPYGTPRFARKLEEFVRTDRDGALRLPGRANFSRVSMAGTIGALAQHLGVPARRSNEPLTDMHSDIAASLQAFFEQEILKMARFARTVTGEADLLFCGGCAQNCVAAAGLRRSGIFDRVFTAPVGGDMGSAVGAAVMAHRVHNGGDGKVDAQGLYLGPAPGEPPPEAAPFRLSSHGGIHEAAARVLAEGAVIGWVRGRLELGARALGARSILADPRVPDMQAVLNAKIKYRESFRPFAPAILAEDCPAWFDAEGPSDYMEYTAYLLPRHRLPARTTGASMADRLRSPRCRLQGVVHVDYSARVQTVRPAVHPDLHRLIEAFKALTGVPMIINTSFNVSGQPIVRTAADAWRCFRHTDIDFLVINDDLYRNPRDRTQDEKRAWAAQFEKQS